jgi:hypothetical protein
MTTVQQGAIGTSIPQEAVDLSLRRPPAQPPPNPEQPNQRTDKADRDKSTNARLHPRMFLEAAFGTEISAFPHRRVATAMDVPLVIVPVPSGQVQSVTPSPPFFINHRW